MRAAADRGQPAGRSSGAVVGPADRFALDLVHRLRHTRIRQRRSVDTVWLTPTQQRALDLACAPLWMFGSVYHVGSSLRWSKGSPAPRDVDVRLMVDAGTWGRHSPGEWTVLADHIGRSIEAQTGVSPIDFQVQEIEAANAEHSGMRSACGILTRMRLCP